ncbi:MAG TPA: hypothetical protein VJ904_06485 [Tichowtungia sp.]|nr:hypothetical protein [Tichowtungia sp.]
MKTVKRRLIGFSVASYAILGACSSINDGKTAPARLYQNVLDRLGSGSSIPLYAGAAVHTPDGLWNVYIMSAPPDRLIFRQSRQNAEIEFGMNSSQIWRENMLTGRARALGQEWRYFIRSYELFRLGAQLSVWKVNTVPSECKKINDDHDADSDLCLIDQFGERVSVEIGAESLPVRITRELPEKFGGGVSVILPTAWTPQEGNLLMTGFRQQSGAAVFDWDIQSVMQVPDDEISVESPASLH